MLISVVTRVQKSFTRATLFVTKKKIVYNFFLFKLNNYEVKRKKKKKELY